jgi:nucleotide-binding universal stress UspA family protein
MTEEGRVVVGVANTVAGYQALRFAVGYARQRGAPLVAVRAVPFRSAADAWPETRQALFDAATGEVMTAFTEAFGRMPEGVAITMELRSGPPAEVLLSVATRPDDLLVIGAAGGRWRLPGWTARTARRCLRLAACPVVAVPASELAQHDARRGRGRKLAHDVDVFLRENERTSTLRRR